MRPVHCVEPVLPRAVDYLPAERALKFRRSGPMLPAGPLDVSSTGRGRPLTTRLPFALLSNRAISRG